MSARLLAGDLLAFTFTFAFTFTRQAGRQPSVRIVFAALHRTAPHLHRTVPQVINQLLLGTDWGELEYLIIDMPPGN